MKVIFIPTTEAVVAINKFIADTQAEHDLIKELCAGVGSKAILCSHWADGSKGTIELAHEVVKIAESGKAKYKIKMDRSLYGSINGGGPEFLFQTMNGDILIHKK